MATSPALAVLLGLLTVIPPGLAATRRWSPLLVGAVAVVIATTACGGSGDKTFSSKEMGITFKYPSSFTSTKHVAFADTIGAQAVANAAIALDDLNVISISRYRLKLSITAKNLGAHKDHVDTLIASLANRPESGRPVEYGGMPGYEYGLQLNNPVRIDLIAVLFNGANEYLVNCQSAGSNKDTLIRACRKALTTMKPG